MDFYFISILSPILFIGILASDRQMSDIIRNFTHVAESIYEILGSDGQAYKKISLALNSRSFTFHWNKELNIVLKLQLKFETWNTFI